MNLRTLLLGVLLMASPVFGETVALPDTPAAHQLGSWLRVFARGDQQEYARFITERYSKALLRETSAETRAGLAGRTYLDARSFEIRRVEKSTQQEIVATGNRRSCTIDAHAIVVPLDVHRRKRAASSHYGVQRATNPTTKRAEAHSNECRAGDRAICENDQRCPCVLRHRDHRP